MTHRLQQIFDIIPNCQTFADIGCDHGYISMAVVKSGKAEKVFFSDISKKCLAKAELLLEKYVKEGRAFGVVSNGFEKLPLVDCALIAGMGGEEILSILKSASTLPEKMVLQPMKNSDKLRVFLVEKGYKILSDFTFKSDGKFYDLILVEKGKDQLTKEEIFFGRTNLFERPDSFIEKWEEKLKEINNYLSREGLSNESRQELLSQLKEIQKIC